MIIRKEDLLNILNTVSNKYKLDVKLLPFEDNTRIECINNDYTFNYNFGNGDISDFMVLSHSFKSDLFSELFGIIDDMSYDILEAIKEKAVPTKDILAEILSVVYWKGFYDVYTANGFVTFKILGYRVNIDSNFKVFIRNDGTSLKLDDCDLISKTVASIKNEFLEINYPDE